MASAGTLRLYPLAVPPVFASERPACVRRLPGMLNVRPAGPARTAAHNEEVLENTASETYDKAAKVVLENEGGCNPMLWGHPPYKQDVRCTQFINFVYRKADERDRARIESHAT